VPEIASHPRQSFHEGVEVLGRAMLADLAKDLAVPQGLRK
jgi:hypothetical protein